MKRFRVFLEMPILCLGLTGIFSIGMHAISWSKPSADLNTAATEYVDARPHDQIGPSVILTYCSSCHQSGRSGIDFTDDSLDLTEMRRNRADWELVVKKLRAHEMPPRKFPQPTTKERNTAISWIEQEVLGKTGAGDNGRLMARRLQRTEYIHSIRDLFGIRFQPDADFPKDELSWGRYADVPELAPVLLEKYRAAAAKILAQATVTDLGRAPAPEKRINESQLAAAASPRDQHLFSCSAEEKSHADSAREKFAGMMRRAYRRPVEPSELDELVAHFERTEANGKSYEEGIKAALLHILTSPHFLYRSEMRDAPDDLFALASRLSFFLWRSLPDDELLDSAEHGELADILESQAKRMLHDPRAQALAPNLTASWLTLGKLDEVRSLDESLRKAMRLETEQFVAAIVCEDRNVLEFVNADYTFVNQPLAEHYGIPGVSGEEMRRITLQGTPRGGLLTQASILTITSAYADTSPVIRGKWVMEKLLGAAPIRPPAGLVQALQNTDVSFKAGTMRQQFEQHRANPSCAECHAKLDAIGFALENFDPRGAWRSHSNTQPVEAIGIMPDGEVLHGVEEVKAYLMKNRDQFVRALGERLLGVALGRKLDERDRAALVSIPENSARHQYRFSRVLLDVIQSDSFRQGFSFQGVQPEQQK